MLILRRKEGQWVEVTHSSGDVIRIRVTNIRSRYPGQLDLVFDDEARNFKIDRPERAAKQQAEGTTEEQPQPEADVVIVGDAATDSPTDD